MTTPLDHGFDSEKDDWTTSSDSSSNSKQHNSNKICVKKTKKKDKTKKREAAAAEAKMVLSTFVKHFQQLVSPPPTAAPIPSQQPVVAFDQPQRPPHTTGYRHHHPLLPSPWNPDNLFFCTDQTGPPEFDIPPTWYAEQNGTRDAPWIVKVDVLRPERNLWFDIQAVSRMEHSDFLRNGFVIRRVISVPDYKLWNATIPDGQHRNDPEWEGRLVLIQGPAQEFWIRNVERYHGTGRIPVCPDTERANWATKSAMQDSGYRFWAYFLLVFPPTISLQNFTFSEEEETVKCQKIQ